MVLVLLFVFVSCRGRERGAELPIQFAKAKKFPPQGQIQNFSETEFYKNNTKFQKKRGDRGP